MNADLSLYNVTTTLAAIDEGMVWILALGAISLLCNFAFFGTSIRLGFKHQIYTVPVAATMIFIPHDFHYLLQWEKWFVVYDHWFMQLFFVGLIITNVMEFIFLYQLLKFGRKELLPSFSQPAYVAVILTTLAASCVIWYGVKTMLADELWFFSFGWTVWFCLPFVIPLMLRRGSAIGQNTFMWVAYIGMMLAWWAAIYPLDPFFRSFAWIGLGVVTVVWALATIAVIRHFEARESVSPAVPGAEPAAT